jgi:hypothetical protein
MSATCPLPGLAGLLQIWPGLVLVALVEFCLNLAVRLKTQLLVNR